MQTTLSKSQQKRHVFDKLLTDGDTFLTLDPRKAGVVVPKWLQKQAVLTLQFGTNLPIPIRDLEITDEEVRATLSFSRTPFLCVIPWAAVYAVTVEGGRGVAWTEDFPPDLPKSVQESKKRRHLRAVKDG